MMLAAAPSVAPRRTMNCAEETARLCAQGGADLGRAVFQSLRLGEDCGQHPRCRRSGAARLGACGHDERLTVA